MFSFEKMLAWQKAVEWSDSIFDVADRLHQKYQFSFGDQLRRACLSVSNNLAEGSGRRTPAGQRYFYDVAHGSIYEVVSVLAILKRRDLLLADEYDELYKQGDEVASIVYGLSRATFEAEKKQESRSRVVREPGAEYGLPDELQ